MTLKVHHINAHMPKGRATEEHQNNEQVDKAVKIEIAQVDLDWERKGMRFWNLKARHMTKLDEGPSSSEGLPRTTQPRKEMNKIFYKKMGVVSQSLALVLVGDFNLPDVYWKYNTVDDVPGVCGRKLPDTTGEETFFLGGGGWNSGQEERLVCLWAWDLLPVAEAAWGFFSCRKVAPIQKRKYKTKSACPDDDDGKAGPSQAANLEPEIITESLSYDNLRKLQADIIHHPNEPILTWMIRVWDSTGDAINLDGGEARFLRSIA
ncbi:hypothetical protein BTVI_42305 [Pitangus sulphuratus]|nr:hypothetical protein BTVI_42305 [Pitangus sulphuratus]